MDAKELESYEYQLTQVNATLKRDPTNTEMLTLREEISNLISLTKDYLATQAPAASTAPSKPTTTSSTTTTTIQSRKAGDSGAASPVAGPSKPKYGGSEKKTLNAAASEVANLGSGDQCMAKYAGDGKYYPAKITSVAGSSDTRIYTVVFRGYDSTELLSANEIKPLTDSKKRAIELSEQDADKEKKRKKNEKKTESKAAKAQEQMVKQKSWQSFAKKGSKKGVLIPGLSGESMFASPDNPFGKVGVVGSGKGMTAYESKQKHKFTGTGAE